MSETENETEAEREAREARVAKFFADQEASSRARAALGID